MNLCAKPSCARPGSVVLSYEYSARKAILQDPTLGELDPHLYVLCGRCAERLSPPRGWTLEDRREEPPLFVAAATGRAPSEPAEPAASELEPVRRQLFFGHSLG